MATKAAKQVVLELCGELLGRTPRPWDAERIEELAERVDRIYGNQQEDDSSSDGVRILDTRPEEAA